MSPGLQRLSPSHQSSPSSFTVILLVSAQKRSPFILLGLGMLVLTFGINISDAPRGVKYFGVFFCVARSYAAFPGVVSWLCSNLASQYKRRVGMALHIGIGNFSGAIEMRRGIFLATRLYPPRICGSLIRANVTSDGLEFMFIGTGLICTPLTILIYLRINAQRKAALERAGGSVDL